MIRWIEIALTIAGAIIVAYMTMNGDIQASKVRVTQLEQSIVEQRADNKEIRAMLLDIKVQLAKLSGNQR
jgi:cell division protein FtsB